MAEFLELHEAVKAIEHFGRSRNKLIGPGNGNRISTSGRISFSRT